MKITSNKRSLPVRASATILMVPKVVALIPQIIGDKIGDIKENVGEFKQEVNAEVDQRVNSVRGIEKY